MRFFESIFHKKETGESVLLIDIGAEEVTGAYARYDSGETPTLHYTRRVPIEILKDEDHGAAMIRALSALGADLIRNGAPRLMRAVGSGSVSKVLVAIDAPWQETRVHTELFEEKEPFIFTKSLVEKRLRETEAAVPEKTLVDESIIGTILNGYETHDPYGKKVHRASAIILTSLIAEQITESITTTLRESFHTKEIFSITGNSLRYQVMQRIFPHERDVLIFDATSISTISIALVRKGIFVYLGQLNVSCEDAACMPEILSELSALAKRYPLPRTLFLIAREANITSLREMLEKADLASLWLSDNPPKFVPLLRSQLAGQVRQLSDAVPDITMLTMALYYQKRHRAE